MKRKKMLACVACSSTSFNQLFCSNDIIGVRCAKCGTLASFPPPHLDGQPKEKIVDINALAGFCEPFQVGLGRQENGGSHERPSA